jgi:hypothetical protein
MAKSGAPPCLTTGPASHASAPQTRRRPFVTMAHKIKDAVMFNMRAGLDLPGIERFGRSSVHQPEPKGRLPVGPLMLVPSPYPSPWTWVYKKGVSMLRRCPWSLGSHNGNRVFHCNLSSTTNHHEVLAGVSPGFRPLGRGACHLPSLSPIPSRPKLDMSSN